MSVKRKAPETQKDHKKSKDNSKQEPAPVELRQTLYVRNLDTKVSTPDLRTCLYMLFSPYGKICALNASKAPKMRGQAHIGFANADEAATALKELQGMEFLGKPLRIEYSKSESLRIEWEKPLHN